MQAFIFDMDGVIIDSEPIHNKVVKEVLLENNIVVDDEEFNKLIGMTSTSVFSYFIDKHHLPYTPEEMTNNHMNFFKKYIVDHNLKPIDGICPLLATKDFLLNLFISFAEFFHKVNKSLATFHWHCIINRCTHTTNRTMTFYAT